MRALPTESGRSRTSSYTSPKAFMPKQPQIQHNHKALSTEKLFQRTSTFAPATTVPNANLSVLESDRYQLEDLSDFNSKVPLPDDFNTLLTPIQQNIQASKAYLNAMKALQARNKTLEEEKREFEAERNKERSSFEAQIKEIESLMREKSAVFESLEGNLKEKLFRLEETNSVLQNNNRMLETEYNLLREEKERLQESINRQLRDTFAEKNELKGLLKMSEDKTQYLRRESEDLREELQGLYNVKQSQEGEIQELREKVGLLEESLRERGEEYENEREKIFEKLKSNEEYYEKLVEGELGEKQEIFRELNALKTEYEKVAQGYEEAKEELLGKSKENEGMREKVEQLMKENAQLKSFSEYTQEVNEKLINNFINESLNNISQSRQRTPENPNKYRRWTENPDYVEKKKQYRTEYEETVKAVQEMEGELRGLIEKYRQMSLRIVNFEGQTGGF